MADKGFDIEEDLIPLGVKLHSLEERDSSNMVKLLPQEECASLRIHVE